MCAGIGVHTGAHVRLVLTPAPVDTGIVFIRADLHGADARIQAHADYVSTTQNGTTLCNEAGVEIATVEHLLAACAGLEIDNLFVEVDGPERLVRAVRASAGECWRENALCIAADDPHRRAG
jgi:UDP-3-O-[3-hydroxymyristoyl] N-acetylglucosamine deacetylase